MRDMAKTKRAIPEEQKKREGEKLLAAFERQQAVEPSLTQESLIHEMGLKSQSQFVQWCSGATPIPDKRMIWLASRLGFDAAETRPSLASDYVNVGAGPSKNDNAPTAEDFVWVLRSLAKEKKLEAMRATIEQLSREDALVIAQAALDRAKVAK